MSDLQASSAAGQRGPADHSIRDQIIAAADEHFSHYGYGKTTVADLAKAIGFSKAYIYKFFESKQAIGEAICSRCLGSIIESVEASVADGKTATDRLRRLFKTITSLSCELFFNDRKLYDIAAYSCAEHWPSSEAYVEKVGAMLAEIIQEGRASGEFERKTPIDEAVRAIVLVFQPFMNPVMLQYNLDAVPEGANEVASLVLRSLAP
ncbi:TetR/AcrR family transcriptional regulator [Sphingomonas nostoxanthinifaciens]|uniref:TetR/AcrR family transcriptional regulator n=1 Tax=Sphingomonas nostoxanthinifaciens TaxID=2872652 RepID=UPI001CC20CE8|nr:TetR/AcrR family transcriptional regulator [Sphingomonas nostoxanthinifaciens]UAK24259.1 TetR/AcrR family transcriptional regulator [Sphingomonas nostoxanthinifaciens]